LDKLALISYVDIWLPRVQWKISHARSEQVQQYIKTDIRVEWHDEYSLHWKSMES